MARTTALATRTHTESAERGGRPYHLERRWTPLGSHTTTDGRRYILMKVIDGPRVLGTPPEEE